MQSAASPRATPRRIAAQKNASLRPVIGRNTSLKRTSRRKRQEIGGVSRDEMPPRAQPRKAAVVFRPIDIPHHAQLAPAPAQSAQAAARFLQNGVAAPLDA